MNTRKSSKGVVNRLEVSIWRERGSSKVSRAWQHVHRVEGSILTGRIYHGGSKIREVRSCYRESEGVRESKSKITKDDLKGPPRIQLLGERIWVKVAVSAERRNLRGWGRGVS